MSRIVRCKRSRRSSNKQHQELIFKPRGRLNQRVEAVGPAHFGIVAVDPAKGASDWMLSDFYGRILIEPRRLPHDRGHFQAAIAAIRQATRRHDLRDLVVAIERTGRYHLPVKRAMRDADLETRMVHPFATKRFREPASPAVKTDAIDLGAIFRATVNGFGLLEPQADRTLRELQFVARHRRDLVHKNTVLRNQVQDHLEMVMPGYAALFGDKLFDSPVALPLAEWLGAPALIRQAGPDHVAALLRRRKIRFQRRTIERIDAWAQTAAAPDVDADLHRWRLARLREDLAAKAVQIHQAERRLARLLARTPYVLMLSLPGVNVVSASDLGGEMGMIEHYRDSRSITGRAGLFPYRHQTSDTDHQGKLVRCANRRLRYALTTIADNLRRCNHYFRAKADLWKLQGHREGAIRIRIAHRVARITYQLVAGRNVFAHPACRERHYVLSKLARFLREHHADDQTILKTLTDAGAQLPDHAVAEEIDTLRKEAPSRPTGRHALGTILLELLEQLGQRVQSTDGV